MATISKPGPEGGLAQRLFMELLDRVGTSNQGYNFRYGTWDRAGARRGAIQTAVGALAPGAGTIYGMISQRVRNAGMNNTRGNMATPDFTKNPYGGFIPQNYSDINRVSAPTDPSVQSMLPEIQPYVPTIEPPSGGGGGGGYGGYSGPSSFQSIGRSSLSNNYNPFVSGIDPRIPRTKKMGA